MKFSQLRYVWRHVVYATWTFSFSRIPGFIFWSFSKRKTLSKLGKKLGEIWVPKFEFGPIINRSLTLVVSPDGSKFYCPISDASLLVREIYFYKIYDRFSELSDGQIVVDVGANVGLYCLKAAKKVGLGGCVIGIEPHPYIYKILLTNIKMNNLEHNVMPVNTAIADFSGKARLYLDTRRHYGQSSLLPVSRENIVVEVDRLDTVIKRLGVKQIDQLKIDVEGYELKVLKSAKDVLKTTRGVVVAAYHYPDEEEDVKRFLKSYDFKILSRDSIVYAYR